MNTNFLLRTLLSAAAITGCASPVGSSGAALELSGDELAGTLAFLNDPATDLDRLDIDCRFYSNSARETINHRNGPDGRFPGGLDNPYDTWEEFQGVTAIGPAHEQRAFDCAVAFGYVACTTADSTLVEDYAALDADLQAAVDAALVDANASITSGPAMRFFSATTHTACGAVTGYEIRLGRLIDPEGGIIESATYTLDAELNVLDVFWDAG